jgi:hypothetical protein
MRKAAKPEVVGSPIAIYSPDKAAVVINGREVSSGLHHGVWAKVEPPRIIINVTEERRQLSLWPAGAWLRDKLQRLARLFRPTEASLKPSPQPQYEPEPLVDVVYAPVKQKSRRKHRRNKASRKRK